MSSEMILDVQKLSGDHTMPNISFDTQEAIPEGLRDLAKQVDGKFVIDVVPAGKLEEFRTNNVKLATERDELGKVVTKLKPLLGEDDVDTFIVKHGELSTVAQKVKDGSLKASDAIETEVVNRVAQMKTGFESQLSQAQQEKIAAERAREASDQRYNRSVIANAVTQAVIAADSGAMPEALNDILGRAYDVFHVDPANGKLIAKDGDATIYGADGATPMTPKEWMVKLRAQAPYFFRNSNGGGSNGGNNPGGSGGRDGNSAKYAGMTKEAFEKLSPQNRIQAMYRWKVAHPEKKAA